MAYQPHSSMTVYAAFVADVDRWLRRVCRVGRLGMDKQLYQDAILCKTLMFNLEVAHEMT